MVTSQQARAALGAYGEDVAARHLRSGGMVILARNYRCELGEIDIVARESDVLVVCEVKTRRGLGYGSPQEAVTPDKARRLRRLGAHWLSQHPLRPRAVRVDVVAVLWRPRGAAVVEHLRGVA